MNQHASFYNLIKLIHDIENNNTIDRENNETNISMIRRLLSVTMVQIQDQEAAQQQEIDKLNNKIVRHSNRYQKKIDELQNKINLHKMLNIHKTNDFNRELNRHKKVIGELYCEINNQKNNIENVTCFTQDELCGSRDDKCCVCMEKPKNHAFTGCGHMCVCGDCVDRCLNKCPLCRAEGGSMRIIY